MTGLNIFMICKSTYNNVKEALWVARQVSGIGHIPELEQFHIKVWCAKDNFHHALSVADKVDRRAVFFPPQTRKLWAAITSMGYCGQTKLVISARGLFACRDDFF